MQMHWAMVVSSQTNWGQPLFTDAARCDQIIAHRRILRQKLARRVVRIAPDYMRYCPSHRLSEMK
jgi:hypothetical protein